MRRTESLVALVVAALLIAVAGAPVARASQDPAPATYIVTLDGVGGDVASVALSLLDQVGSGQVVRTYEHALDGFAVELAPALAPVLGALPGVVSIERDTVVTLSGTQPGAPYGLDRIDQRSLPLSGSYEYQATGAGVTAYIIDTGIRGSHSQFAGRVRPGTNTVDGSSPAQDCNGHGTHVAGTVGGSTYGVAKSVSLVAVRVFGCGDSTTTAAIIDGVDWVVGDHQSGQPAVANMSLGGGSSAALDAAVRAMIADGVTTAVASGNESTNGCSGSPAGVAQAITTGATDSSDRRASFSNFGTCVDVHAPGVGIVSASPTSDTATASLSGTSMATPHVAGAAAVYLADHPSASPAAVHAAIVDNATPGVVSGIKTSCSFLDNLTGSCMAGTPNRLLYTGTAPVPPTPPPPASCSGLAALLGQC
ncbi:S8 family peptidase [Actinospongicola halichondriae]|uniref:S8 family peptidase n=1 Tax=Actinospongicola halichondriae TaxID=3236844 RepID=UPI003D5B6754